MLNIRRNVIFSLMEVSSATLLTFFSYRVIVVEGGISELGIWSTLMAWLGIAKLGDFGLGGSATRFVAPLDPLRDADRIRSYIDTAILSNLALVTFLSLAGALAVSHWLVFIVGSDHAANARPLIPWLVGAVVCNNSAMVVTSTLYALHRSFVRSIIMVTGNLVQLGLVLWLVPKMGLTGFAIAQIVQFSGCSIAAWLCVCFSLGRIRLPVAFRLRALRELLGFSLKLQVASILNSSYEPLSKMLVSHFGGMHVQGLYEAAFRCVTTARNLFSSTSTALIPAMARLVSADLAEAQRLYRVTLRNTVRGLPIVFGGLVLAAPVISFLWFRSVEFSFWAFLTLLCVGHATAAWCAPAYNLGQATGEMGGVIKSTAVGLLLLAIVGTIAGLLAPPVVVVVVVSGALVIQNLLVRSLNEPILGLNSMTVRTAAHASSSVSL